MLGQIVHIWYEAHVFVKYDAWNDFGSGNFVSFPILIVLNTPNFSKRSSEGFSYTYWGPRGKHRPSIDPKQRRQAAHSSVGMNNDLAIRYTMGVMMSPEEMSNQMIQSNRHYVDIPGN